MGKRRPDFIDHEMKLIIEYDGEQHFHQLHNRLPCERQQLVDTWKAWNAIRAGYTVIRIPYDFLDIPGWEAILIPNIRLYNPPRYTMMKSHRSKDLYRDHAILWRKYRDDESFKIE